MPVPSAARGILFRRPMIIAIDGPAASGKSTAARALAARLGLVFLDTGSMYRAVTRVVLVRGLDPRDADACARVACELTFALGPGGRLLIDVPGGDAGRGRTGVADAELRTSEVTARVSEVAAHSPVRRVLVAHQQALGRQARERAGAGVVAEGRDTTTVVFPDADLKLFLVASPAERARRRALELGIDGGEAGADERRRIQRDIERRDTFDASRADSPLRQHPDAIALVTDGLDAAAVLEALLDVVRRHCGALEVGA
jgi:pantoate ligase/cytidylate kinase